MNVFISGGCKNGKSSFAERIAKRISTGGLYYVATMIPYDKEDDKRIANHIASRAGMGFTTLEIPRRIEKCLEHGGKNASFLIDSVTALLVNELYPDIHSGSADPLAAKRCREGLIAVARGAENAVFVSDYIFSDCERYDGFTEEYRAGLASIDRALARECDCVIELCAGNAIIHKGGGLIEKIL